MPSRTKALLAALLLLSTGCVKDIYSWDLGYPDVGPDSSQAGIQRFKIEEINEQIVKVGERSYSRISFDPIFRHFSPEVLSPLQAADGISSNNALVTGTMVGVMTYAAPEAFSEQVGKLRDIAVVAMVLAGSYLGRNAQLNYDEARDLFNASLTRRLSVQAKDKP